MSTKNETESLQCPTCGAKQPPADSCRRCKCDLTLVHQMRKHCRQLHRDCLVQLREGDFDQAREFATRYHELMPDDTSRRLLTVCCALSDDMPTAVWLADVK